MCSCISPMASRIVCFKASIGWLVDVTLIFDNGTPQIIVQRCQIAAARWPNDISFAADNAIFKNRTQNIECSFGSVARSAILLKPNVANILLFNFCEQKFLQHGPITIASDWNGLPMLIFEEKWPNYASGPKSAPNSDSFWMRRLFNVCVLVFCAPNVTIFACLYSRQDQNELHLKRWFFVFLPKSASSVSRSQAHLAKRYSSVYTTNKLHLKRWFFLPKTASSVSRSQAHLAKRKRIGWSIDFKFWTNWTVYGVIPRFLWKIVSMMPTKCSTVKNDGELMLMKLHTHFLRQQQYSWMYALFLAFHALVYRCQFLSLFSQDKEHTELTVLLFFQNPYAIFAHIMQH